MSSNAAKIMSTAFLLAAVTAISYKALDAQVSDFGGLVIAVGLLVMLLFGMSIIWVVPERIKARYGHFSEEQSPEKAKRGSRREEQLALLMDLMDDEELAAFKETLKRRVLADPAYEDGELPYGSETLESLLRDDDGGRKQLRRGA